MKQRPGIVVIGIIVLAVLAVGFFGKPFAPKKESAQEREARQGAEEERLREGRHSRLASDEFRELGSFVDTIFVGGTQLWTPGFYVNQRLRWMGGLVELETNSLDQNGQSIGTLKRKKCEFIFRSYSGNGDKGSEGFTLELTGVIRTIEIQEPLRTQVENALRKGGDHFRWREMDVTVKGSSGNLQSFWIEGGWLSEGYTLQDIDQLSDVEWDYYEEGYLRVASWIKEDILEHEDKVYVHPASYYSTSDETWGKTNDLLIVRGGESSLVRVDGRGHGSGRIIKLFEDFSEEQKSAKHWTPERKISRSGVQYETGMGRFGSELKLADLPERKFPFQISK